MSPTEAMTLLIQQTDETVTSRIPGLIDADGNYLDDATHEERDLVERHQLAISVVTAMLNTALPVARFRCFVEVDPIQPVSKKGEKERTVTHEFTVCGVNISSILSGIAGLVYAPTNVRVLLFEQRPTGADMISAYQGKTKTLQYRNWLKTLPALGKTETMQ